MTTNPQTDGSVRGQLLRAIDFSYVTGVLGYPTPEALLAAYDAAVLPAPTDRAAIRAAALREAADYVGNDDDCECGGCDTCLPRKMAAELRRRADEATAEHHTVDGIRHLCHADDHYCPPASGSGCVADETQAEVPPAFAPGMPCEHGCRAAADELVRETQAECTASISGSCLREAESETACDTEDGECVHGGRPGTAVRCSAALLLGGLHDPHEWQPQPGMPQVHCPGAQPDGEA